MRHLLLLLVCSCAGPFPLSNEPNYTDMPFRPQLLTPAGVRVDDPRGELDLPFLDHVIAKTMDCLAVSQALPREFGVQVPPWLVSPCSGEQVFDCYGVEAGCAAKGLTPTADCPCRCRAVIQDNAVIITTPNLKVFPGRLVTLLTGVSNPWADEALSQCAGVP